MRAHIPMPGAPAAWATEVIAAFSSAIDRLLLITLKNDTAQANLPPPDLARLVDFAPDLALEARGIPTTRPVRRRAARASDRYLLSKSPSGALPFFSAFIGAYIFGHVGVGLLSSAQASAICDTLEEHPQLLSNAVAAVEPSQSPSAQASLHALAALVRSRRPYIPDDGTT